MFGYSSKDKEEKSLKKAEVLSTYAPLHSCDIMANNVTAIGKPVNIK